MKFELLNKSYDFPVSLKDITLRQRIEFDEVYGKELLAKLKEITPEKGDADETELLLFNLDTACKNVSFFSGIPLKTVRQIPMDQVMRIYHSCFLQIQKEEESIELKEKYLWKDEFWVLESPELSFESEMTFNEFITAKQIVKTLHDLGKGMWSSLPSLCAIFLRKKGESFDEKFLSGQTKRTAMMLDLPLDIALCVAFFLRISMSMYMRTIPFSTENREVETGLI